jgi:hypothetical protein
METLKRLLFIYCKDCNKNVVENPNFYGLCINCKNDYVNKQNEKIENTKLLIKNFIRDCDDNRKNELLEYFFYNYNYLPKELETAYGNEKSV